MGSQFPARWNWDAQAPGSGICRLTQDELDPLEFTQVGCPLDPPTWARLQAIDKKLDRIRPGEFAQVRNPLKIKTVVRVERAGAQVVCARLPEGRVWKTCSRSRMGPRSKIWGGVRNEWDTETLDLAIWTTHKDLRLSFTFSYIFLVALNFPCKYRGAGLWPN